jgi:hypothetical protein
MSINIKKTMLFCPVEIALLWLFVEKRRFNAQTYKKGSVSCFFAVTGKAALS